MNGSILFDDLKELAEFLKAFVGCTATFEVVPAASGRWCLTFTEGF